VILSTTQGSGRDSRYSSDSKSLIFRMSLDAHGYDRQAFYNLRCSTACCSLRRMRAHISPHFATPLSAVPIRTSVLCSPSKTRRTIAILTGSEPVFECVDVRRRAQPLLFNRDERTTRTKHGILKHHVSRHAVSIAGYRRRFGCVGKISAPPDSVSRRTFSIYGTPVPVRRIVKGELQNVVPWPPLFRFNSHGNWYRTTIPESDYTLHPPVPSSAIEAYTRGMMAADPRDAPHFSGCDSPRSKVFVRNLTSLAGSTSWIWISSIHSLAEKSPRPAPTTAVPVHARLNYYNVGDFNKSAELFSALPRLRVLINLWNGIAGRAISGGHDHLEACADLNPLGNRSLVQSGAPGFDAR